MMEDKVIGHLMVDEMELKLGVYFHTKSHNIIGFVTEDKGLTLDAKIKQFLEDSKAVQDGVHEEATDEAEEKGIATYLTLW